MLKRRALGVMVVGCVLLGSETAAAQVSREEFEALKAKVELLREAINGQAEVVKQLLERAGALGEKPEAPFQGISVNIDGAAFYGTKEAKVTIVEFADYECPFCARYSRETFPQIDRDYIQTGRVKYVFRDFPIEAVHPQAFKAHEAVHCAGAQGKRREMHEKMFASQRARSGADLNAYAQELRLDLAKFQTCLADDVYSAKIRGDLTDGHQSGVMATPTFFLGLTETDSPRLKAVRKIEGARPYSVFKAAIEDLLSSE
jgi:protein-disulfide isomerase